ncbi:MAG TPA: mechanosensitive ion channel family protein [Casimicrobiaceae bacterium]
MPLHGGTLASWVSHNQQWIAAVASLLVAFVGVALIDRFFSHRARRLAAALTGGHLAPAADTRLQMLRRVLEAFVIFIGVFVAMSQFDALDRLANSVLASSAIVAAAVGFASRQTLANGVAGFLLAVTQPLRIGDEVTFEGESGTVEDVRLTYTYLRNAAGARIVIPNERLAAGVLRNDTVLEPTVGTEVSLWLAPEADAGRALEVLRAVLDEGEVSLAEIAVEGTRLVLNGPQGPPETRAAREADLRARAYAALRGEGLR